MIVDKEKIKQLHKEGRVRMAEDLQALLKQMTGGILDAIYEAEADEHIGYAKNMPGGSINTGNRVETVKALRQ